ncbi:MAG: GNAT family N-acetyltransferase [Anaerolineae bacterium]|nr:GNAT family N-acetyltransferase [Anaerolineae bacterium]
MKRTPLEAEIVYRLATAADLPKLEWMGEYTHFRRVFQKTFREQQLGERLMLVAEFNDFPIGQIFVLLRDKNSWTRDRGYLYSLRVMRPFQGLGIGTALIRQAEGLLHAQNIRWALIAVAKENNVAKRLYEREGYIIYAEDEGHWSYENHEGEIIHVHEPCWMLEKRLRPLVL